MNLALFIEQIEKIDIKLFIFLNSFHSSFWDEIMWLISGKYLWIPLYILLLYFLIRKYKLKSIYIILLIVLLITLSDQISTQLFKNVFQRFRPCHNQQLIGIVHLVNGHCGGKYGFVSSHASNSFALAVFMCLLFKNKYFTVSMLFWAFIVSYSRIYLGVHYPADVFCGACLGTGLSFLIYFFYTKLKNKFPNSLYF